MIVHALYFITERQSCESQAGQVGLDVTGLDFIALRPFKSRYLAGLFKQGRNNMMAKLNAARVLCVKI